MATGWPILVVGSGYVTWQAARFYREVHGGAVARLVVLMVAGWLVTMYSLATVATLFMLRDLASVVPVILPTFGLWFVTMVAIIWAMRHWLRESSTLHALYRRLEALVDERTAQLAAEVDQRRRAEQSLAARARELERSNRELEEFVHTASHDLQEPLRGISLFVQLLQKKHSDELPPVPQEYLDRIGDSTQRMQGLLQDLLQYARLTQEAPQAEPVDSEATLREAMKNLEGNIEETGAEIQYGMLPSVCVNRFHLIQVWQNLIGNAIKFRRPDVAPRIEIAATPEESTWHFTVKDNGIGIPAGEQRDVFQVFRRLHDRDQFPGSGIGLSTCKKIIELAGGRIWVESEAGQGSTFHFNLPRISASPLRITPPIVEPVRRDVAATPLRRSGPAAV